MVLVCIWQYALYFPTANVENAAEKYAIEMSSNMDGSEQDKQEAQDDLVSAYLDSMSNVEVLSLPLLKDYTYQDLKSSQLALGLDLKGGMSVVMQVDLRELIWTLANSTKDPTFEKALNLAKDNLASAQSDYVALFGDAWQEVGNGEKLNKFFRKNAAMKDKINTSTTDGEMERLLREEATTAVQLTYDRLKERIDKLGVVQPNISLDEARDLIIVELPGIRNPERARKFLKAAAKLEFWNTYRSQEVIQSLVAANEGLRAAVGQTIEKEYRIDTLWNKQDELGNDDRTSGFTLDTTDISGLDAQSGPLLDLLSLTNGGGAVVGRANPRDIKRINELLAMDAAKNKLPRDLKLLWSKDFAKEFNETGWTGNFLPEKELYAIKMDRGSSKAPLEGDVITDASYATNPTTGEVEISMSMNQKGARLWGNLTTASYNDGQRPIAIVLDNEVVSAPGARQPILTGRSSISGNYTLQQAKDEANILKIGKLPASLEIIQENIVGPTLGEANINKTINSLLIGFLLVIAFMIFYYGGAGIVSIIALILNIAFIFAALASVGAVLTLAGAAGVILTVGMAVDANVIIYERIREELREGKSLKAAVSDGFSNSYSAIIDANITTFLTAGVLFYFGLGPIKGFATVLMIGVVFSVFTAVLVGRLLIDWWIGKGNNLSFWTAPSKNAFANVNIDWLGKRKMTYTISGILMAVGILAMVFRGFDLGVEFKGGYSTNVEFAQPVDQEALKAALTTTFEGESTVVKSVDTDNTLNIVTSYKIDEGDEGAELVMKALFDGVNQVAGGNLVFEDFKNSNLNSGTHITSSSKVGPTIADDIRKSAIWATIVALIFIFLYILLRFSKWQYSAGAVAALFHDVIITMGLFALLHGILPFTMEIDQAFIAAILTVIGYSINDTVVVFDRIREYMGLYTGKTKEEIVNAAVNSTVSRTIITSLTTLFVIAILLFFGGASIRGFAFALFIGVLVGTYSSIFVATPIMTDLSEDIKPVEKKRSSFSRAGAKS